MQIHQSFYEVARNYRVILFDAYGVLKASTGVIDGVLDVLARLKQDGIDCYAVTNDASRSPAEMAKFYVHPEYGPLINARKNISSGRIARQFLRDKVRQGKVAYLGKPGSTYYIASAGLEAVPVSEVQDDDDIKALVLADDEGFDWFNDLNATVNLLRHLNIPVIVANTDLAYPVRGTHVAVAVGSLANMLEGIIGKTFIRFGKPDGQIFTYALERCQAEHPDVTKREILMVGDTLHTDIIGANKFGLDSALVLSGNTQKEHAALLIDGSGIVPDFVFESILT